MRRDVLLTQLGQCDEIVKTLTDQLDKIAAKHPGVMLLQTIPEPGLLRKGCGGLGPMQEVPEGAG